MTELKTYARLLKTAVMRCLYFLKILNRYSPYCPHCSSCGETGCCSPTVCINHPKGHYCETNQDALKVSYWTLNEFWNNYFKEQSKKEDYNLPHLWTKKQILKEVEEALGEIYSKNYGEQREYRMSLPERQSFSEKIKSLIRKRSVK